MAKTNMLGRIAAHCDSLLRIGEIKDYSGAANGLQVENDGSVTRIAAAVDGSLATIAMAVQAGADLLIVHHGLFWGPSHPWTGKRYEMLKELLDNNLAVYSAHLPLDMHPVLGNNVLFCRALGFNRLKPFFFSHENWIGLRAAENIHRDVLVERVGRVLGAEPKLLPGGPLVCRKIGVVTGGAGDDVALAASEGVDTFITGEGRHWTYALAEELGVNVIYGGHYATETFGVKALARHLSSKFKVPWQFIDHPTGL